MKSGLLAIAVLFASVTSAAAQQPAFPGAEGFGRFAQGGRGGDVYYVENLNDAGPGSLREGIRSANGPRTILFRISGTIALNSPLRVDKPFITIAGQTAPGDGITVRNHTFIVSADHVIVRYVRSRLGDLGGGEQDAISISSGSDIILDHCSASWSVDETLSATSLRSNPDLVTVQWCLVSESLYNSIHSKGPHGMGGIVGADRVSYHHNLVAHHNSRLPKLDFRWHLKADVRNNVIYNWGNQNCYDGSVAHVNWANNYYKPGPATRDKVGHRIFLILDRKPEGVAESALFYVEGNYMAGFPDVSANNWAGGVDFSSKGNDNEANTRVHAPFDYPRIGSETSAVEAYEMVLASAGASLVRDSVDRRIVEEVRKGTSTYGRNGIIDSQSDVGGWPELASKPPPRDADDDGMPDWWEQAHGLDPQAAADPILRNCDGYTKLEEYLYWLADPQGRFLDRHPGKP